MMKIYKILILMLTMCCSAYIYAGQYVYHKGTTTYEVKEYHDEYMVLCFKKGLSSTSRNKNITDRLKKKKLTPENVFLMTLDRNGTENIVKREAGL